MDVRSLTAKQLRAMADKREREENRPVPAVAASWDDVKEACERYLDSARGGDADLYNEEQAIFSAAIEALYGEGVWDWVNAKV